MAINVKIQQRLQIIFEKKITEIVSGRKIRLIAEEMGQQGIQRMYKRIDAGKDINGAKFKKYSKAYIPVKKMVVSGRRVGKGRGKKRIGKGRGKKRGLPRYIQALIGRKVAPFNAQAVNNFMRLTGEMYAAFRFRVDNISRGILSKNFGFKIIWYIDKSQQDKAEGNILRGRKFFGLTQEDAKYMLNYAMAKFKNNSGRARTA